jgi:hypothetical protein
MSYSTVGDPCFFTFGFASLPWQGLVQGGEWSVRCCFFIAILTIAPKDRSYLFCTVTVSAGETTFSQARAVSSPNSSTFVKTRCY